MRMDITRMGIYIRSILEKNTILRPKLNTIFCNK